MARAATTADAFNAVAEPRRRQILDLLAGGERPVNDLVRELGLAQPQVSKHLRVLREVDAVAVRDDGRRRLYRLNGRALKPIHDWVKAFEQSWSERFDLAAPRHQGVRVVCVTDELRWRQRASTSTRTCSTGTGTSTAACSASSPRRSRCLPVPLFRSLVSLPVAR
jgi:DNA-binding transcriptional ArsR family regulator